MSTIVYSEQFTKALPSQVYYALTHAGALTEWLCDFATVAPRPGGRMYLWWHGDFYSAGEYIELVENTSIRFKWFGRGDPAATEVLVTLEKKRGGTQVRFAHAVPDGRKWLNLAEGFKAEWDRTLPNLAQVLETGLDKRTFDRPMLGINVSDFNAAIAKTMGVPVAIGMRLDEVVETMGAYAAGLRKDDVLVELNGYPITSDYGSFVSALQGKKGGDKVSVVFYRGSQKKTVKMELSKRPIPEIPWETKELAKQVGVKKDGSLAELEACFKGVSEDEAGKEPAPGEWSAKQTLAHLIQGERAWLGNMDDAVGGYPRVSDEWGGNNAAYINATVTAYGTTRALLDELHFLSNELVAFLAALSPSFVDHKAAYFLSAYQSLEIGHTFSHLEQIKAAIAEARRS